MKILISFLFLIGVFSYSYAQSFGSEGTVWQHCIEENWPYDYTSYKTTYIGSIQEDRLYQFLAISDTKFEDVIIDTMIVFEEDNKLYLEDKDSTIILFDYSLEVGDTFGIVVPKILNKTKFGWLCDQSIDQIDSAFTVPTQYVITGIEDVLIDDTVLKKWQINRILVQPVRALRLTSFTERLGFNEFLFPLVSVDYLELNGEGMTTSYQDDDILYQSNENNCTTVSTDDLTIKQFELVHPNPTSGNLTIRLLEAMDGRLTIRDVTGHVVSTLDLDYTEEVALDLSAYHAGMYVVEVVSANGETFIEKIILH